MLEARSGAGPIKAYPRAGAKLKNGSSSSLKGSGLQNKTFHCQICDVHVNSEIQLKQVEPHSGHIHSNNTILTSLAYTDDNLSQGSGLKVFSVFSFIVSVLLLLWLLQHISSRRHKDRVAGKPTKPKYSPYNKQQRSSLTVSVSLPSLSDIQNNFICSSVQCRRHLTH